MEKRKVIIELVAIVAAIVTVSSLIFISLGLSASSLLG
jgi:hypothetical protein